MAGLAFCIGNWLEEMENLNGGDEYEVFQGLTETRFESINVMKNTSQKV